MPQSPPKVEEAQLLLPSSDESPNSSSRSLLVSPLITARLVSSDISEAFAGDVPARVSSEDDEDDEEEEGGMEKVSTEMSESSGFVSRSAATGTTGRRRPREDDDDDEDDDEDEGGAAVFPIGTGAATVVI